MMLGHHAKRSSKVHDKASQKLAAHADKILQNNSLMENNSPRKADQLPPVNDTSKKVTKRRSGRTNQKPQQKMVGCLTEAEI